MVRANGEFRDMGAWVVLSVLGVVGAALGQALRGADTGPFSCNGRSAGYYADVSKGCQIYHMCDGLGRQFSYSCPNATLFQQRMLICDHWYMVNCSRATADYSANLLIGQKDKLFVEDSEMSAYSRTPRPDLLNAPSSAAEYNLIYRIGETNLSPRKFVGVENSDERSSEEPTYFPPSQWSTEAPKRENVGRRKSDQIGFENRQNKALFGKNDAVVYKSNFKATTPVYPQSVEDTTGNPNNIGLQPPDYIEENSNYQSQSSDYSDKNFDPIFELLPPRFGKDGNNKLNAISKFEDDLPVDEPEFRNTAKLTERFDYDQEQDQPNKVVVNFQSNFKATTPQYPSFVDTTSPEPGDVGVLPPNNDKNKVRNGVNFESRFKATTPQYPTFVESTSANPVDVGLLPPQNDKDALKYSNSPLFESNYDDNEHVQFESNFKATTPQYPTFVESTSPNPDDVGLLPPQNAKDSVKYYKEPTYDDKKPIRVQFESRFKATTPQYPTFVESTSPNPVDVGLLPPQNDKNNVRYYKNPSYQSNFDSKKEVPVQFESKFKATTPQYPTRVDSTSPNPFDVGLVPPKRAGGVAYKSTFRATTPKYPPFVDATSPDPSNLGIVAPGNSVVNFHSDFKATTPVYPKLVASTSPDPGQAGLLPPQNFRVAGLAEPGGAEEEYNLPAKPFAPLGLQADYTAEEDLQELPGIRLSNFMKSFNKQQWQMLRHALKIPEYDFPLDDFVRPGYDSVVNSFEPKGRRK
ncbi:unnamed protein product [Phyllotreta striolata]|uniref:Chitin-binding type-2 domain-containing protein n=1 Tax=Phyllotreta striolata TaxID=444603 RepID=A0A9P0DQ65_PHYSR|nr:unnamed protein product [Phyllotreta striolata]